MGSKGEGLETAPGWVVVLDEWDLLRRCQLGQEKKGKEHATSNTPHFPAHMLGPTQNILILPLPFRPPPAQALPPAACRRCSSSLPPLPTSFLPSHASCPPARSFPGGLPFVLKHLAGRNPAAMQFHCLHAKSINELISKVK